MWAEQITAEDSSKPPSVKKEVSGYDAEEVAQPGESEEAPSAPAEPKEEEEPEQVVEPPTTASEEAPVAFPSGPAPEVQSPVAFPTSEDSTSQKAAATGSVKFGDVATPPRSGTPEVETESRRKRISSQNFQRLAKRVSLGIRRKSSHASGPSTSQERREGSAAASTTAVEGESGSVRDSEDAGTQQGQDGDSGSPSGKKGKRDSKKRGSLF